MDKKKFLQRDLVLLIVIGLAINFLGVKTALFFEWPLFMDSIGTLLAAALGGYLPGIIVGFFSNSINAVTDPITLYYGIISVLFAIVAAWFSRRGIFRHLGKTLLTLLVFSLLGGGLGSVLTWLLYGFNFGSGISAPLAVSLHEQFGWGVFVAQLTADFAIDIFDKTITLLLIYFILKILPDKALATLPLGYIYINDAAAREAATGRPLSAYCVGPQQAASAEQKTGADSVSGRVNDSGKGFQSALLHGGLRKERFYRKISLRNKVIRLIIMTAVILGTLAISISYLIYKNTTNQRYTDICQSTVNLMASEIDADKIDGYLNNLTETSEYNEIENNLLRIRDNMNSVRFMYVYKIREDGCHVVFDLDTADVAGGELGEVVPFDPSFEKYIPALLHGEEIEPIISNDSYGWLLTVYKPLLNSEGICVAYAAADIDMENVVSDRYIFIIRIISLLFGASILIVSFAVWFAEKKLITPINSMAVAAGRFAFDNAQERQATRQMVQSLNIRTGDEIENLYQAMCTTISDMAHYIEELNDKNQIITGMQNNIIISFASMVENRDENTGDHIKRTAGYVGIIGKSMQRLGIYPDIINDNYLEKIIRSAPLHDIGKIKITDAILNKPGRLTDEEFEIMKTHTTSGRDILKQALGGIEEDDYLGEAMNMAAYHHEKWNGRGYPEGLVGEKIPLCARIMAVADVFDALVSKRSYKEAMSFEKAVSIIEEEAGQHFDPQVVTAFLACLDEIKSLSKANL